MPKHRKSMHRNKAPLIFTESPVNKQSNVPSPVCCARHPLTAKSVPIEDLQELSWVSPQFRDTVGTSKKVKKQRRRRSTSGPKCTCHCGSNQSKAVQNNKFKPLKFIGDKTPPVTIIEDISFSEEDNINENISEQSTSPCLNRSQTAVRRKARPSRSKRRNSDASRSKCSSDEDHYKKHSEDLDQTDDNFNTNNLSVHTPVTNLVTRNILAPVIQNETICQVDEVVNDNITQTPVNKVTSPVKRLFTSNNSPESNVFSLIKNRKSLKKNKRHSHGLLKNLYVSMCSPNQPYTRNVQVLVADTPEAEYGIPRRLRRLRKRDDLC